jgi:hypothetical protein
MTVHTQSTDFFSNAGVVFVFATGDELVVSPGVVSGSGIADNVESSFDQNSLANSGVVYSTMDDAVSFSGNHCAVVNYTYAVISGDLDAIRVDGDFETIDNYGGVFSLTTAGVYLDQHSANVTVTNYGEIVGQSWGILVGSLLSGGGGNIQNFGLISSQGSGISEGFGIDIDSANGLLTTVLNAKGATIEGVRDAIQVVLGELHLTNAGSINGTIDCADIHATDTIINTGTIYGAVDLSGAVELFNGRKGFSGDINTGNGNDTVILGKGNLSVHIDAHGNSTLTAGTGHDTFVFDDGLGGGSILIKHFNPHLDNIELSEFFFPGLGPVDAPLQASHFGINGDVHNANPQIVYNDHNGFLFYDSNGDLPGGRTHFGTLVGAPPISHANIFLES